MLSVGYLAGFTDGEGSLSLNRIPRRGRSTEYCVRLSITNSNRGILREIQGFYGGTLAQGNNRNSRWKPGYVLIWTNAAATQIIETIAPCLVVKARQAKALLEFSDHIRSCRRRRDEKGRLLPLSEREMEVRRAFFRRLKLLNAKGRRKASRRRSPGRRGQARGERRRITLEYLAGFMDGEGSVMITRSCVRNSKSVHYRARVSLTNTDRRVLEDIRDAFGGIFVKYPRQNDTWKTGYGLVWTEGMIRRLLPRLRPHLRLKQRQADHVLEFIDHVRSTVRTRNGRFFAPHPKYVMEFRDALYRRMRGLNMKGRRKAAS